MSITVLTPEQTREVIGRERPTSALLTAIVPLKDTGESVFATGLSEPALAALRGALKRRGVQITVRSVVVNGERGHIILPTSI